MLARLLLARSVPPSRRNRLDDHQPPSGFQRFFDVLEHGLVLGHFVIGVYDQHRVEQRFGQMGIGRAPLDHFDVFEALLLHARPERPQHRSADVHREDAPARTDGFCEPDGKKTRSGANVRDHRARLQSHRREDVANPLFLFALSLAGPQVRSPLDDGGLTARLQRRQKRDDSQPPEILADHVKTSRPAEIKRGAAGRGWGRVKVMSGNNGFQACPEPSS